MIPSGERLWPGRVYPALWFLMLMGSSTEGRINAWRLTSLFKSHLAYRDLSVVVCSGVSCPGDGMKGGRQYPRELQQHERRKLQGNHRYP
jgi:hypothetical protein